jgi:hypothetical protein
LTVPDLKRPPTADDECSEPADRPEETVARGLAARPVERPHRIGGFKR